MKNKHSWIEYLNSMERWIVVAGILSLSYALIITVLSSIFCFECILGRFGYKIIFFLYDITIAIITGIIVYFLTYHIRHIKKQIESNAVIASHIRRIMHTYESQISPIVEKISDEIKNDIELHPLEEGKYRIYLHHSQKCIQKFEGGTINLSVKYIQISIKEILHYIDATDKVSSLLRDISTSSVFMKSELKNPEVTYNEVLGIQDFMKKIKNYYTDEGLRK